MTRIAARASLRAQGTPLCVTAHIRARFRLEGNYCGERGTCVNVPALFVASGAEGSTEELVGPVKLTFRSASLALNG
jgi:hypothetical protein